MSCSQGPVALGFLSNAVDGSCLTAGLVASLALNLAGPELLLTARTAFGSSGLRSRLRLNGASTWSFFDTSPRWLRCRGKVRQSFVEPNFTRLSRHGLPSPLGFWPKHSERALLHLSNAKAESKGAPKPAFASRPQNRQVSPELGLAPRWPSDSRSRHSLTSHSKIYRAPRWPSSSHSKV